MDDDPSNPGAEVLNLVVSATFTAEPIEPVISFWMQELGMPAQIRFAPYGQVMQQLLDPTSLVSGNPQGINILLVRLEDWLSKRGEIPPDQAQREAETNALDFARAVSTCASVSPAEFVVVFCPPSTQGASRPDIRTLLATMETSARDELEATTGVYVIGFEEINSRYPISDYYDRRSRPSHQRLYSLV